MPVPRDTPQTYPTFTNHALGEGILDQLMAAVDHHVKKQYDESRIQNDTYGTVYLGALEVAMTQSVQFLLGQLLLDEKRRGLDLSNQKAEFEIEFLLPKQLELINKNIEKITKEIEFLTAKIQTEKSNTEGGIADATSLVGKQITLLTAQRLGFAGDIQVKVGKLYSDYDAIFQSVQEFEQATNLADLTQDKLTVAEDISSTISGLI